VPEGYWTRLPDRWSADPGG